MEVVGSPHLLHSFLDLVLLLDGLVGRSDALRRKCEVQIPRMTP